MLAIIAVVLLLLWLVGFTAFHVGSLIHFLLIAGIVLLIWHFLKGSDNTGTRV